MRRRRAARRAGPGHRFWSGRRCRRGSRRRRGTTWVPALDRCSGARHQPHRGEVDDLSRPLVDLLVGGAAGGCRRRPPRSSGRARRGAARRDPSPRSRPTWPRPSQNVGSAATPSTTCAAAPAGPRSAARPRGAPPAARPGPCRATPRPPRAATAKSRPTTSTTAAIRPMPAQVSSGRRKPVRRVAGAGVHAPRDQPVDRERVEASVELGGRVGLARRGLGHRVADSSGIGQGRATWMVTPSPRLMMAPGISWTAMPGLSSSGGGRAGPARCRWSSPCR